MPDEAPTLTLATGAGAADAEAITAMDTTAARRMSVRNITTML